MNGVELQRRREALGLSRRELAAEVGVNHVTIWRWEARGKGATPIIERETERILSRLERRRATPRPHAGEGER